jgi:RimJ/RimL family protein N-acetyltransferase
MLLPVATSVQTHLMSVINQIVYDTERALGLLRRRLPGFEATERMVGMVLLDAAGAVKVAAAFEGFNGANIWLSVAAAENRKWASREVLQAAFAYAFIAMGVRRVSARVDERNVLSRRMCLLAGFRKEARLQGAAPDGHDQIIYVMHRRDCRFIPQEFRHE